MSLTITNTELYDGVQSGFILIVAKSGRGKSTSIRTLPAKETFIINILGKPLPFLGAAKLYKEGVNMLSGEPSASRIIDAMQEVSKNEQFKYLVIDDILYSMGAEFMQKVMIRGYEKFSMMAKNIFDILMTASSLRGNLKVFVMAHEEETETERRSRWFGKLIEEKIIPEALSTIVLFANITLSSDGVPTYYFQTQSDGVCGAKAPMGMLPPYVSNDLLLVSQRMDEYYAGVELKDSKLDFGSFDIKRTRRET